MTEIIVTVTNTTRRALTNDGVGEDMLMSVGGYIAAAITLFFIGFFGFFLNFCVIVLMWKDKQLWTPLNIILFNLVCSDFSVSILGNPWTLASAISYRWIFGKTMCKLYGFFMSLLGKNITPRNEALNRKMLVEEFNLSFHNPANDRSDTCDKYITSNSRLLRAIKKKKALRRNEYLSWLMEYTKKNGTIAPLQNKLKNGRC
ncbi:hypothetical protein JTB14_000729 [Gonioctena quinquepunctata]|nr:hypothetical protein JTB14_000729 [Gonioctena quinquepunctata]